MHKIERSALVQHSAADMYALVNDVTAYPEFLKWCRSSRVICETADEMEAELEIAWKVLHKVFTTHNHLRKNECIQLKLVSGPFKSLTGEWGFKHLREDACKITMEIEFEFKNAVSNMVFSTIFSQLYNSLIDSFIKRADVVYGK
jgi:ribosome-associated toxin RatA of RatAB toxin-antitoxin module